MHLNWSWALRRCICSFWSFISFIIRDSEWLFHVDSISKSVLHALLSRMMDFWWVLTLVFLLCVDQWCINSWKKIIRCDFSSPFVAIFLLFFLIFFHSLAFPYCTCMCLFVCLFLLISPAIDELALSYFSLSLFLSLSLSLSISPLFQSLIFCWEICCQPLCPPFSFFFFISPSFIWLREIPTHQSWINNISYGSSTEENRRDGWLTLFGCSSAFVSAAQQFPSTYQVGVAKYNETIDKPSLYPPFARHILIRYPQYMHNIIIIAVIIKI